MRPGRGAAAAAAAHLVGLAPGAAPGGFVQCGGFGLHARDQKTHRSSPSGARRPQGRLLWLNPAARQIKVLPALADTFFNIRFAERTDLMDISPLSTNTAMTAVARQLNTNAALQTEMLKQMADIVEGLRDNPTMYPFAKEALKDPQELANTAAYIQTLCIPTDHGKYEGPDAAQQIAKGKELYEKQCKECHGAHGEGNAEKFYPVIAGQHYKYLLRQMTEIRDGKRRNANPDMVKVIKPYTDDQLVAISAYQASLSMPGKMCAAKPAAKGGKKK
jgi:cytochrome c553